MKNPRWRPRLSPRLFKLNVQWEWGGRQRRSLPGRLGSASFLRRTPDRLKRESYSPASVFAEEVSQVIRFVFDCVLQKRGQTCPGREIQRRLARPFCLFHVGCPSGWVFRSICRAKETDPGGQLRIDQAVLKSLLRHGWPLLGRNHGRPPFWELQVKENSVVGQFEF